MAGRSREKTEDAEQGRAESGSDTRDSPTAADARLHHDGLRGEPRADAGAETPLGVSGLCRAAQQTLQ